MQSIGQVLITGGSCVGRCRLLAPEARVPRAVGNDQTALTSLLTDDPDTGAVDLFAALRRMSNDILREAAQRLGAGEFSDAEAALTAVCGEIEGDLRAAGGSVFAARADDIADLGRALLLRLRRGHARAGWGEGDALVCERISVLDALDAARCRVACVILQTCSPLSHAAIVLQSGGIPIACGLASLSAFTEGRAVALNARAQRIALDPDPAEVSACRRAPAPLDPFVAEAPVAYGERLKITLSAMGSFENLPAGAEVGLLRSELFCLTRDRPPREDEMTVEYASLARRQRGVTVRLLDAGADKETPWLSATPSPNPALGMRGVRLLLRNRAFLCAQLSAILRASACGNVRALVPMVTSPEEVTEVRRCMEDCRRSLRERGVPMGEVSLGTMIETPAAAILADELARVADFAALGVNDLTQYVLARDRGDDGEAADACWLSPAVLRLIERAYRAFVRAGKPVSVCGGMAAERDGLRALLALGVRSVCVPPPAARRVAAWAETFSHATSYAEEEP